MLDSPTQLRRGAGVVVHDKPPPPSNRRILLLSQGGEVITSVSQER